MTSSFPRHDLRSWHWHCNINFWIVTNAFWKRALVQLPNSFLHTQNVDTLMSTMLSPLSILSCARKELDINMQCMMKGLCLLLKDEYVLR